MVANEPRHYYLQVKTKGARKIHFPEFEKALDLVATKKVRSLSVLAGVPLVSRISFAPVQHYVYVGAKRLSLGSLDS